MTRKFVELHDEKWIKENCICRKDHILNDKEWLPKVYADNFAGSSTLLADNKRSFGMYRTLVGKIIEVKIQSDEHEPKMNGYGFRCAEGVSFGIPTWLIKAYWEVTE